jgi:hypothetical protein
LDQCGNGKRMFRTPRDQDRRKSAGDPLFALPRVYSLFMVASHCHNRGAIAQMNRLGRALIVVPVVAAVAFGFWWHFPNRDRSPRRLAELALACQRKLDLDCIKFFGLPLNEEAIPGSFLNGVASLGIGDALAARVNWLIGT